MSTPEAPSPLVSAGWLARRLASTVADAPPLVVVDTRWYLDGRSGAAAHEAGHIPGAAHLDVDRDLASPRGPDRPGRHPLPNLDAFAESLARVGVAAGSHVVAYDDEGGAIAARLWWLLEYVGFPCTPAVLDGGLQAWLASGGALERGPVAHRPAPRVEGLAPRADRVVDRAHVRAMVEGAPGLLLDARATPRYEGVVEPIDPRAGHVPGAKSAPFAGNLTAPQGCFLDAIALRQRFETLGAHVAPQVVVYCGSGVTACHDLLALRLAGLQGILYEGSWSDWSSDASLPLRVGREP